MEEFEYRRYTREVLRFYFTRTSRRHKIGRAHTLVGLFNAGDPVMDPNGDLRWQGFDDRGICLEIVGFVSREDENLIIIKHVMPTEFRRTT